MDPEILKYRRTIICDGGFFAKDDFGRFLVLDFEIRPSHRTPGSDTNGRTTVGMADVRRKDGGKRKTRGPRSRRECSRFSNSIGIPASLGPTSTSAPFPTITTAPAIVLTGQLPIGRYEHYVRLHYGNTLSQTFRGRSAPGPRLVWASSPGPAQLIRTGGRTLRVPLQFKKSTL